MADSRSDPRAPRTEPFYRSTPIRPASSAPVSRPPASAPLTAAQRLEELRRKALAGQVAPRVARAPAHPPRSQPARRPNANATPAPSKLRHAVSAETVAKRHAQSESRAQLIERLSNPLLTLQETALLLNVCPATVRRWANAGVIPHERTGGNQRRFRWLAVRKLMRGGVTHDF